MSRAMQNFLGDQTGAITVDWVVLTAISAAFGIIVMLSLGTGTNDMANTMETALVAVDVAPLAQLGYSE